MFFMYQGFMLNKELKKSRFIPSVENDHEHCTMCGAKFSANHDDIHEGYVTGDHHWVCADCAAGYKEEYRWILVGSE